MIKLYLITIGAAIVTLIINLTFYFLLLEIGRVIAYIISTFSTIICCFIIGVILYKLSIK